MGLCASLAVEDLRLLGHRYHCRAAAWVEGRLAISAKDYRAWHPFPRLARSFQDR